jgi:hypothetical protein|tara:strand:+ start:5707 stop:5949 length:243 start_codon:yes stop_codon:yes gene_type:complete
MNIKTRINKISKVTFTILLVALMAVINTIKGGVIMTCGYGYQYWFIETISLLLGFGLLYFILKSDRKSNCTTVINERIKK